MATVLLLDDDILFKAVEGTCLRRERCRLVMAAPGAAHETARREKAELILASTAAGREALASLFGDAALGRVPMIVVDFGGPRDIRVDARKAEEGRTAPIRFLRVPTDASGRLDFAALDPRFDAALKEQLPGLSRRSDRVSLDVPVACRGRGFERTLQSKNISPTGLFLKTGTPLPRGRRFRFSLTLPPEPGGETVRPTLISGRCEVVRQVRGKGARAPAGGDLIPGLGVRILDMDEGARRTLRRFVRAGRPGARPAAARLH